MLFYQNNNTKTLLNQGLISTIQIVQNVWYFIFIHNTDTLPA